MTKEIIDIIVGGETFRLEYYVEEKFETVNNEFEKLKKANPSSLFAHMATLEILASAYSPYYRPKDFFAYSHIPLDVNTIQLHGYVEKEKFINDIRFLVNSINDQLNNQPKQIFNQPLNITRPLDEICQKHINNYGRLIDIDLLTYIDELIHILKAISKVLDNEKIEQYYIKLSDEIVNKYLNYMYMADPPRGIVKLTDKIAATTK